MDTTACSTRGAELHPHCLDLLIQEYAHGGEATPADVLDRVANAIAKTELVPREWEAKFRETLGRVVLGGKLLSSAGLGATVQVWTDSIVQPVADSLDGRIDGVPGIMEAAREAAQALRRGCSVKYDFSAIRPRGSQVGGGTGHAGGPLAFMRLFSTMGAAVTAPGMRTASQEATLRCDHPDIEAFLLADRGGDNAERVSLGRAAGFSMTVAITDALMSAVVDGRMFNLTHPARPSPEQIAAGATLGADGNWIYKRVRAKELLHAILRSNYDHGDLAIVFSDQIARDDNLRMGTKANFQKGGQGVGATSAPFRGQVVLPTLVTARSGGRPGSFDFAELKRTVSVLVRMLDNLLDLAPWPLDQHERAAQATRRVGVGVTGLGDMLASMGLQYDSAEGREMARAVVETTAHAAYAASVELAVERGSFPLFDPKGFLEGVTETNEGTFASRLPIALQQAIRKHGLRNSQLLCLVGLAAESQTFGNGCSSGIAPVEPTKWGLRSLRGLPCVAHENGRQDIQLQGGGGPINSQRGHDSASTRAQLEMLANLSHLVDSSEPSSVSIAEPLTFKLFVDLYVEAWCAGLKGLKTRRA